MSKAQRFCLIQDNDSHWYVCPAERVDEAQEMFDALDVHWSHMDTDKKPPPEPDFLRPVDGSPGLVSFTDPRIGDEDEE